MESNNFMTSSSSSLPIESATHSIQYYKSQQEKLFTFYHHQDLFFGVCFFTIGCFTLYRILNTYQLQVKSLKVITLFNSFICITSMIHAFWFLIPNRYFNKYYLFNAIDCGQDNFHNLFTNYVTVHHTLPYFTMLEDFGDGNNNNNNNQNGNSHLQDNFSVWKGKLGSEVLIALSNLTIYSLFIIISCYWYFMHKKVEDAEKSHFQLQINQSYQNPNAIVGDEYGNSFRQPPPGSSSSSSSSSPSGSSSYEKREFNFVFKTFHFDAIELFGFIFFWLFSIQFLFLFIFYCQGINSQQLLLYNSIFYVLLGYLVLWIMNDLSEKVLNLLDSLPTTARGQSGRIYGITMLANVFCFSHVILDGLMAAYILYSFTTQKRYSFEINTYFYESYLIVKSGVELFILVAEIFVSSPIKSNNVIRQIPLPFRQNTPYRPANQSATSSSTSSGNNNNKDEGYAHGNLLSSFSKAAGSLPIVQPPQQTPVTSSSYVGSFRASGNTETLLYQMRDFSRGGANSKPFPAPSAPPMNQAMASYQTSLEEMDDDEIETMALLDDTAAAFQRGGGGAGGAGRGRGTGRGEITPVLRGDSIGVNNNIKFV